MEISFPSGHEGSSYGAALIGMEALGLIESIEVAAERMTIESVVAPEAGAVATYSALLPVFAALYDALVPAFTELRKLDSMVKADAGERQVKD
jgi:gluconokinase